MDGIPTRSLATPQIRATYYALTDRGRTRDHNEDTFLLADLATAVPVRDSRSENLLVGDRGALYLVADGMGGAAAGELASEMAATSIHRYLVDTWQSDPHVSETTFATRLREAVELANLHIREAHAREHPEVRGMGTTVTVAGIWRDHLYLAQIGDSRGYLVRNGQARQLTRDQSLTQRLVDVGELTEEEAEASERRNIILQALGPDALVKVDVSSQALQQGDVLIICSDGLSNLVRRDDIARIVSEDPDLATVCHSLVTLANERGGPDNITVIAARFEGDGLPEVSADEPGYHELLTAAERPALQNTAAIQSYPRPVVVEPVAVARSGSPTGMTSLIHGLGCCHHGDSRAGLLLQPLSRRNRPQYSRTNRSRGTRHIAGLTVQGEPRKQRKRHRLLRIRGKEQFIEALELHAGCRQALSEHLHQNRMMAAASRDHDFRRLGKVLDTELHDARRRKCSGGRHAVRAGDAPIQRRGILVAEKFTSGAPRWRRGKEFVSQQLRQDPLVHLPLRRPLAVDVIRQFRIEQSRNAVDDRHPGSGVGGDHGVEFRASPDPRHVRHATDVEQDARVIGSAKAECVRHRHQRCALPTGSDIARPEIVHDAHTKSLGENCRLTKLQRDDRRLMPHRLTRKCDRRERLRPDVGQLERHIDGVCGPFRDVSVQTRDVGDSRRRQGPPRSGRARRCCTADAQSRSTRHWWDREP